MTREEAINKVRQMNLPKETKEILEALAPELRESEDERIRKALIEGVRQIRCKNGITQDQMLAYLEKQKDERELGYIEGKVEGVRQTCQEIKDAMSLFEPKDLTPFEFTFRDYIDSAIRYCLSGEGYQQYIKEWSADLLNLEKQKEQKPRWEINNPHTTKWTKEMIDEKFEELVEEYHKQKPVVTHGETYHVDTLGTQQVIAGKMPQKPAEWSEEDERMRQTAIEACKTVAEDYENSNARFYKCKDWLEYRLKSLRPVSKEFLQPHWKPSKEQMEALKKVACNLVGTGTETDVYLIQLFEQLKKL